MKKKLSTMLGMILVFTLLAACNNKDIDKSPGNDVADSIEDSLKDSFKEGNKTDTELNTNEDIQDEDTKGKEANFSVWAAYWSKEEVEKEVLLLKDVVKEMVHFAAYFDAQNNLFVPKETQETFQEIGSQGTYNNFTHYLSFVNDQIKEDGSSSLKDTTLLYEIFSSETSITKHIESIVEIALQGGYDGVEIDYEGIRKDKVLWQLFFDFSQQLYERLKEDNLKMRIVLEPLSPIEEIDLPKGPEYVMMCYNLYGSGSEPGPKADKEFILNLAKRMIGLNREISFAFSTGGFDWGEDGRVLALTEKEAVSIAKEYGIAKVRDNNSYAINFVYEDEEGMEHEVWYADGKTLIEWMTLIQETGINRFSLWRLSGNVSESLMELKEWLSTP